MADKQKIVSLPGLQSRAQINVDSFVESDNTIEVVAATEIEVNRSGWDGRYIEILDVAKESIRAQRLDAGAVPFIDSHRTWEGVKNTFGRVLSWRIENKQLIFTIKLSERKDIEGIISDIKSGIINNISVGYSVYRMVLTEIRDDVEVYRVTDWEPMEVSAVMVPADHDSGVRAANNEKNEVQIINKLNLKRQMAKENEETPIVQGEGTPETRGAGSAPTPAPIATPAANAPDPAVDPTKAERERNAGILTAVRAAGLGQDFAEKLIESGATIDAARAQILEKFAESKQGERHISAANAGASARVGEDREVLGRREALTDALVMRSGNTDKEITDERKRAANPFRQETLLELAKSCLGRAGVGFSGMDKQEMVQRAITSSTSDFAVLLDGTARRVLLNAYAIQADTWKRFCATGSVSDFREFKRLRMGTLGGLKRVAEGEEYKTKKINDADYESVAVDTWGDIINISRKMIINDDLNGFTNLAAMQGRAAARQIETQVYNVLKSNGGLGPIMADGKTLFHADHGNIATTAAAPTVTSLDAVRQQMMLQMDKDGNDYLDIVPRLWLGPVSLGGEVRVLNGAEYDINVSSKFQVPNRVRGMFKDVIDSPRLSGTPWYVFADPNEEPTIEVTFLDGQQTPYMEREDGFDVDGIRWKTRLDFDVNGVGYKGAIRNAGA